MGIRQQMSVPQTGAELVSTAWRLAPRNKEPAACTMPLICEELSGELRRGSSNGDNSPF